ncbi:MAG: hypothetical protein AMXMBFR44_1440 [Candidatus Campbellbacteria bacterium]
MPQPMKQYRLKYLEYWGPENEVPNEAFGWLERTEYIEARSDEIAKRIANAFLDQEPIRHEGKVLRRKPIDLVCLVRDYR